MYTIKCTRQMSTTCAPSKGLLDAPGEIPLNSEAINKELGIARYQKVQLPTFHEVMMAWDNYHIDANLQCRFWSLLGDNALNRYVQALCMCVILFTFVDNFFGTGSLLQQATEAQKYVNAAIRGTLGFDDLSVKKNVFAQTTTEILGFLVDFPTETVQPKKGAIEKIFFVLFKTDARAQQTLRYWKCLSSLVIMYSPVLRRMRPFIAQINAMTSKATQYRMAHATPSALFEIEIRNAAIIMMLMSPPITLAVPLHMFIKTPRNRNPHPAVSDALKREGFWPGRHTDSRMRKTWSVNPKATASISSVTSCPYYLWQNMPAHGLQRHCSTSGSMTTKVPWHGPKITDVRHLLASTHV